MDQESAERQLLELLRGEDADEFVLRVERKAGRWWLSLQAPDGRGPGLGEGESFWEAWHDIKPEWAD